MKVKTCECGWKVFNSTAREVKIDCPQCGSLIACGAGSRAPFMLGDHLERLLSYVEGRQFKLWYKRMTGKDCGCDKRKQRLNTISERIHRWFFRNHT